MSFSNEVGRRLWRGVVVWGALGLAAVSLAQTRVSETIPPPRGADATTTSTLEKGGPADLGELFIRANSLYEESRYGEAIGLYQKLVEQGSGTGDVHFNLGNAFLRNGELGQAIASYLRSQTLQPRDQDVQANLEFARQTSRDAVQPPAPPPAARTLFFWHFTLSEREKVQLAVVISGLFWVMLTLRLWRNQSELLRFASYATLALLLAVGGSLAWHVFRPERLAVVLPSEVSGMAAPSADSVTLFSLHSGTEIRVTEKRPDWLRVRLPDGRNGWLQRDQAALVER